MKLQGHETVIIVQVFGHLECVGCRLDTGSQGHVTNPFFTICMTKLNMSN